MSTANTSAAHVVTIDYTKSLAEMIAAGKYKYFNEYITADNFPLQHTGQIDLELVLVHFDRQMTSDDAIKEMKQMSLEPAKIEHLLAYGDQLWRSDPLFVVALGSVWKRPHGYRCVPCLDGDYEDRYLHLCWWGRDWNGRWRFLAVRKP